MASICTLKPETCPCPDCTQQAAARARNAMIARREAREATGR